MSSDEPLARTERSEWPGMTISSIRQHDVGWEEYNHQHSGSEGDVMYDQFDVTLEDVDLLGEVELTTNLIIAASEADERLSAEEIDEILGVTPARPPMPRRES